MIPLSIDENIIMGDFDFPTFSGYILVLLLSAIVLYPKKGIITQAATFLYLRWKLRNNKYSVDCVGNIMQVFENKNHIFSYSDDLTTEERLALNSVNVYITTEYGIVFLNASPVFDVTMPLFISDKFVAENTIYLSCVTTSFPAIRCKDLTTKKELMEKIVKYWKTNTLDTEDEIEDEIKDENEEKNKAPESNKDNESGSDDEWVSDD